MATQETDSDPFIPVTRPKASKKARSTYQQSQIVKPEIDTELRIVFELPRQPRTTFNPAVGVKNLLAEWIRHDPNIAVHSLDNNDLIYPAHDPMPMKEAEFKEFFFVHPTPKRPIYRNKVTVGCRILSDKTITELKKSTLEDHTMMEWLNNNHVFMEVDSLGRETIRTIGYFFNIHPRITHKTSFKANIRDALEQVRITKEEVIKLDSRAQYYYDPDDDEELYDYNDDKNSNSTPYVPPFELFISPVGYGTGTTRVATRTIGIKTNVMHGNLLNELLLRMATNKTDNPLLKYVPVGMATTIGPEPYKQLICSNNAYLTSIATIPVEGITDETLELAITVHYPDKPAASKTIKEILLANDWCINIEPTETEGKIFILTTKSELDTARQWLDTNLQPIFEKHLPKNPRFTPNMENPVPRRTDQPIMTATLGRYVDALTQSIPKIKPNPTIATSNKYSRPPPNRAPKLVTISFQEKQNKQYNEQKPSEKPSAPKLTQTKKRPAADNNSMITETTAEATNPTHSDTALADLKQEILNTVRQDLAKFAQTEVEPLRQDIKQLSVAHQTKTDDLNNNITQLQQQMAALSTQMAALLQHLSKPPPATLGGGAH